MLPFGRAEASDFPFNFHEKRYEEGEIHNPCEQLNVEGQQLAKNCVKNENVCRANL